MSQSDQREIEKYEVEKYRLRSTVYALHAFVVEQGELEDIEDAKMAMLALAKRVMEKL